MILQKIQMSHSFSKYGENNADYHFLINEDAPYQLNLNIEVFIIKCIENTMDFLVETSVKFHSFSRNLLQGKIINRFMFPHNFSKESTPDDFLKFTIEELFNSQFEDLKMSIFENQIQTTTHLKAKAFLNENVFYLNEYFNSVSFQELLEEYNFRKTYWNSKLT
jgi:hypothetical protein